MVVSLSPDPVDDCLQELIIYENTMTAKTSKLIMPDLMSKILWITKLGAI
jgi:hypothetical protein